MSDPLFRVYEPWELGSDQYPHVWHRIPADIPVDLLKLERDEAQRTGISRALGVKDVVRAQAGHRCIRCGHPYRVGVSGEWENPEALDPRVVELVNQGQLPSMDVLTLPTTRRVTRAKLWSPCDEQCTHKCYDERKRLTVRVHRDGQPATIPQPDHIAGELAREYEGIGEVQAAWRILTVPQPDDIAGELAAEYAGIATVQAAWRILTVHHISGVKADLRWWNLAALCQRCHLVIQRKVQLERVYPLEHTEWFRPYAAGWYAYAYGIGELSREEVMERLDELLALERLV